MDIYSQCVDSIYIIYTICRELLVSGDSLGSVRLWGWPCVSAKSSCAEDKPVSGPVAAVR